MNYFPLSGSLDWVWGNDSNALQLSYSLSGSDTKEANSWTTVVNVTLDRAASPQWLLFLQQLKKNKNNNLIQGTSSGFGSYQVTLIRQLNDGDSTCTNSTTSNLHDQLYSLIQTKKSYVANASLKVLMSVLQKNVRLQRQGPAVRTVVAALQRGPTGIMEVLRRLPIVIVEDATVHPLLPNIVWLMMAVSKGYTMQNSDYSLLLQVTWECCAKDVPADIRCKVLSEKWNQSPFTLAEFVQNYLLLTPTNSGNSNTLNLDYSLVFSIVARSSFGAMESDRDMLFKTFVVWYLRLHLERYNVMCNISSSQSVPSFLCIPPAFSFVDKKFSIVQIISSIQTPFSVKQDAPITAIDHHCTDIIGEIMHQYGKLMNFYSSNNYTRLGNFIWDYRSSLTTRPCSSCSVICWDQMRIAETSNVIPDWWRALNVASTVNTNNNSNNNNNKNNISILDQYCIDYWQQSRKQKIYDGGMQLSRPKRMKLQKDNISQTKLYLA